MMKQYNQAQYGHRERDAIWDLIQQKRARNNASNDSCARLAEPQKPPSYEPGSGNDRRTVGAWCA